MDWLTFISSLVGHLAWPLVALGIAALLREQADKLLVRVEKFKHGDTELIFHKELQKLEKIEEEIKKDTPNKTNNKNEEDSSDIDKIAAINPSAAIILVFQSVEKKIQEITINLGFLSRKAPLYQCLEMLRKNGAIEDIILQAIKKLMSARNSAAHGDGENIDFEEYLKYKEISNTVINSLTASERLRK